MEHAPTVVEDGDALYWRLVEQFVKGDGSVSSAAFKVNSKPDNQISTDLARLTTPQESVNRVGRAGFLLGALLANGPRALGFEVRHDPLPDNPAHTLIVGENTNVRCRELAKLVQIVPGVRSTDSAT
jgi:hypothetical protein